LEDKKLEEVELNLRLLAGEPIVVYGYGHIKPRTIKDIIRLGYSKYLSYLNIFNLNSTDLLPDLDKEVNIFDVFMLVGDDEFYSMMEEALSFFLSEDNIYIDRKSSRFLVESEDNGEKTVKEVDRDNFDRIKKVVKLQNYILDTEESQEDEAPATEQAKALKKRIEELKKEREKYRSKDNDEGEDIDLFSIISALSSKSNISEEKIFDLTLYQLYTKFRRVEKIEEYDLSLKSLLAGAKDVKIKSYYSKI